MDGNGIYWHEGRNLDAVLRVAKISKRPSRVVRSRMWAETWNTKPTGNGKDLAGDGKTARRMII